MHLWTHHPGFSSVLLLLLLFFKKRFYLFIFLESEERRKKERERNISAQLPLMLPLLGTWSATQGSALTGNRTGDPLVCRPALNPLSHTSQGISSVLKSFPFCVDCSPKADCCQSFTFWKRQKQKSVKVSSRCPASYQLPGFLWGLCLRTRLLVRLY